MKKIKRNKQKRLLAVATATQELLSRGIPPKDNAELRKIFNKEVYLLREHYEQNKINLKDFERKTIALLNKWEELFSASGTENKG